MDYGFGYTGGYERFSNAASISSRGDIRSSNVLAGRGASTSQSSSSNGGGSVHHRRNHRNFKRDNNWENREKEYKRENKGENQRQFRGKHPGFYASNPHPKYQNEKAECKNYICPDCKQPYNYFKNNKCLCGKVPRVLPCEHTICEECINKSIKLTNQIRCVTCSKSISTKKNQSFDYNHYVLGRIAISKMDENSPLDFASVTLVSSGSKLRGSSESYISREFEEKCSLGGCQNLGTVSCLDCCKMYCNKCDQALHESAEQLTTHKRNEIGKVSFTLNKCLDHSMVEELYCNDCEQNCCCYCILEKHEGHSRSYLTRLDEEEELELREAYATATRTLTQLEMTKKKINKPKTDRVSDVELEISQKFTDIHAKLHLIEKKLYAEVKQLKQTNPSTDEFDRLIHYNIENLKEFILCVDSREGVKMNLRKLLEKLKEMEKLPSFLATNISTNHSVKLSVDDKIQDLENYFKLNVVAPDTLKLVTTDEQPADTRHEMSSGSSSKKSSSKLQREANTTRLNKVESPEKNNEANGTMDNFNQETVYVTHIHSLDCFYVQFKKEDQQYSEFVQEIKKHVDRTALGVNEVILNELYMAPSLNNKKEWGRVRVLEEIQQGSEKKYKVMFLDFGNSSILSKHELKYISSRLAKKRPFAVQCRLDKPTEIDWTSGSHLKLAKILNGNTEVVMITRDFSDNIYTVDLNINTSLGELQSVTNLLVVGYEALQKKKEPYGSSSLFSNQLFDNSDIFVNGESYNVFIRYVLDPWHIYVQKVSYENALNNLISSMEQHYNDTQCDIHLPVKNSDVVILYPSKDFGNWHRAHIQEVFNNKKIVSVFLVDWGKQVNINWKNLRKLVEKFKRVECLVVCAKLADVAPKSDSGWSLLCDNDARDFIEKYSFKSKEMKMLVSGTVPLEVILFDSLSTFDENINALLVEHDLVISTGKLSQTVRWLHQKKEEKPDETEFLPFYKDYSNDEDENEEDSEGVKTQVEIVRFDDPYSIYVSFVFQAEESVRLHEELQIHYNQEFDVQDSWNVGDKVVVFDDQSKSYYRGKVVAIEKDYCVYLLDKGKSITVPQNKLRKISPYFCNTFANMVIKCHLGNIKPAGGTDKWSSMSLEWFEKLFEKYKNIYIQKITDDGSRLSMPVTMWYSKICKGTALEPSYFKFISIDKKVIKSGLAFQVKNSDMHTEKIETETDKSLSDHLTCEVENDRIATLEASKPESPSDVESIPKIELPMESNQCTISSWLPPAPITKTKFFGYITCAESEGYLFLRDQTLHAHYKEMEANMKTNFDALPKAERFEMHPYQMVTIWSNSLWYRGTILSVMDKTTAKVMMVDFGSDHIVNIDHLHDKIMYPEIPIMVSKIKLYDVYSKSGRWSVSDVDTLLETVSEYSEIVIRSSNSLEIPLADVYDLNGVCLNDELVKLCPNLYRRTTEIKEQEEYLSESTSDDEIFQKPMTQESLSDSCIWSEQVNETDDIKNECSIDYNYVKFPTSKTGQKLQLDIISVLDYKTVSVYVIDDETKEEEFESLCRSIQEEAAKLETLKHLEIGMPCISRYQEDQQWYRAKIFQMGGEQCDYVSIIYVDYGNFDIVSVTDLKKIKTEWLDFPAKFFVAEINFILIDMLQKASLKQHLQELIGKTKSIEIFKENPLLIHIYEDESDILYYDTFLKMVLLSY
ncbi:hypothetical protein HHI36_023118 [Cryptolaemus montrouzieri]|uniref:Tudor domain-containing protein n=1 Tax=Cryptolaemus montrouzieri TaxID=559131 RepID=A0ABD2PFV2_9CUCU